MADPKPNFNVEKNELEIEFNLLETKGYGSLNDKVDLLLEKKFLGVEQSSEEIEHEDPAYQAKHDVHMDNEIYEETGTSRKLKFKDVNQKDEFFKLVKILQGSTSKDQEELLEEIGWGK